MLNTVLKTWLVDRIILLPITTGIEAKADVNTLSRNCAYAAIFLLALGKYVNTPPAYTRGLLTKLFHAVIDTSLFMRLNVVELSIALYTGRYTLREGFIKVVTAILVTDAAMSSDNA